MYGQSGLVVAEDCRGKVASIPTLLEHFRTLVPGCTGIRFGPVVQFSGWPGDAIAHLSMVTRTPMDRGFEDNPKVSGGLVAEPTWREDALVRLRFEACTMDLPLHSHENSDRCIVVLEGDGMFHYVDEHQDIVQSHAVAPGTMLLFSRRVIHTFTAGSAGLGLLSYHSPFFAFDDRRQWRIPERASRLQPQLNG